MNRRALRSGIILVGNNEERNLMRKVACIVVMSCLSLISSAFGQPGPTPPPASRPDASSVQDKLRQYRELNQQLVSLLEKKDFAASAEVCRKMIELAPRDPSAHYNLACCLARLGKPDDAIAELRRAISAGFVDVDHIRKDDGPGQPPPGTSGLPTCWRAPTTRASRSTASRPSRATRRTGCAGGCGSARLPARIIRTS